MSFVYERITAAPIPEGAFTTGVRMRDGVVLAADVYLPVGAEREPGPTVLIRTPYDKSGAITPTPLLAEYLVDHGYRVVIQDVRGKFRSQGESLLWVNEARDGSDTLDWVIGQPWSDGAVGMAGNSYYGFTQWAALSTQHPALRAITPRLTGTQLGEYPVSSDGGRTRDVRMNIVLNYALTMFTGADTYFWDMDWNRRPYAAQAEELFAAVGHRSPSYDAWTPHPVIARRFPEGHPFDARPIPVLYTIGWWDNCAPWAWRDVEALSSMPRWRDHLHLLIEPIDHYSFELDSADREPIASPELWRARMPRLLGPTVAFLDRYVKGAPGDDIPPVRWTLAGTGEVRDGDQWPPVGVCSRTYVARAGGALSDDAGEPAVAAWTHDPAEPVPSSTDDAFRYLLASPDEAPLGRRDDVVTFTTDALPDDVDLVGAVQVSGVFCADAPDLHVHVRLLDVGPDGRGRRIARGQRHLSAPFGDAAVTIGMDHVGYRVPAGHRLSLHVAASDHPEYLTSPGTGEDPWYASAVRSHRCEVRLGGEDGLTLRVHTLPVIPTEEKTHE